jgi:hypothetical protein
VEDEMNCQSKTLLSLVVLFCFCLPASSQQAVLEGRINDRQDGSPIGAADVIVNGTPAGITGTSGRYVISGLKRGSRLDVTYKKQGYGPKVEHIALQKPRTARDVSLFKDTADVAYWSAWSQRVRKSQEMEGSSARFAKEWNEVDSADISPASKAAAAHAFIDVIPSNAELPKSLVAYEPSQRKNLLEGEDGVDKELARKIRQAIVKDESLSTYSHSVKIIVHDGAVILKGPVRSDEEKQAIQEKAAEVAGADKVTDEIEVAPR